MSRPSILTQKLNLAQQLFSLRQVYPEGKGAIRHPVLTWENQLTPTPLSRTYCTVVTYRFGSAPRTRVLSPSLVELAEGRSIPHLYSQKDQRLCLYLPGTGEWNSSRFISKTIIPWALLWFFYFEEWLLSGEWKGGGLHPPSEDQIEKDKQFYECPH
jgi:hypothetical protein